jgi:hypothetical protein
MRFDGAALTIAREKPRRDREHHVQSRRNSLIADAANALTHDLRPNVEEREERERRDA